MEIELDLQMNVENCISKYWMFLSNNSVFVFNYIYVQFLINIFTFSKSFLCTHMYLYINIQKTVRICSLTVGQNSRDPCADFGALSPVVLSLFFCFSSVESLFAGLHHPVPLGRKTRWICNICRVWGLLTYHSPVRPIAQWLKHISSYVLFYFISVYHGSVSPIFIDL